MSTSSLEPSPNFLNFKTDFAAIHTIRSPSLRRFTLKYMYFQFEYMSEIQWNFEGSLECRKLFLLSLLRLERTLTSIARTPFCSNCVSVVPGWESGLPEADVEAFPAATVINCIYIMILSSCRTVAL